MGTKILIEGVHFKDLTVPDLVKFSFGIERVNVILQLNTPGISAGGSLLNSSYFFDKENNISECLIYNAYWYGEGRIVCGRSRVETEFFTPNFRTPG